MIINVNHDSFYDWEPVPENTQVTPADIKAKRVKPAADGKWLMRVTKAGDTVTTVGLPEAQLITLIIQDSIRDRAAHTRSEALGHYLARLVMPHHSHRNWMTSFDVDDSSGPDQALFERMVDEHIAAGNVDASERDRLLEAYLEPGDHAEHLREHFDVKKVA